MAQKLSILSPVLGHDDPRNVPWEDLKFEYVVAIRTGWRWPIPSRSVSRSLSVAIRFDLEPLTNLRNGVKTLRN
jgi:hypothetical protein